MPRKARAGPGRRDPALHRLQRLHRPLPRRDADPLRPESAHGAGADAAARRSRRRSARRVVVVGAGPAGLAAAAEAAAAGPRRSSLLERARRDRRPGLARRAGADARELAALAAPQLRAPARPRANVELRLGADGRRRARSPRSTPDLVIVATGARPYDAAPAGSRASRSCRPGTFSRGARPRAGDRGRRLGRRRRRRSTAPRCSPRPGRDVTLAVGVGHAGRDAPPVRPQHLPGRLYRAGVRDRAPPGPRLGGGRRCGAASATSSRPSSRRTIAADAARPLARPRPGGRARAGAARARPARRGGRRLPLAARLEEAILEGTLAVTALSRSAEPVAS